MINNVILKGIAFVSNTIASFKEERGQDLIEYAVLAGAIGMVAFIAIYAFGMTDIMNNFMTEIGKCLSFSNDCGSTL